MARKPRVFRSPITGEQVSQGQYRRDLAETRGMTRYSRVKQIALIKEGLAGRVDGKTSRQIGLLAAALVDAKGYVDQMKGPYREQAQRIGHAYNLARLLY